ncbi:FAD/NAD(P)-binding protein [Novosphingobium sp. G106]|uniref:FAD/NAD(P)-binding protein n=1 Tax=Novosphingobium sp. G106 TaxID=2849500 RepID=UPI001C2DC00A|nr:FAD/NAD(P)-binding protein [Novosphingobium sp. G106]MBV1688222.1 FAD/NAD(P)-binding protein [Novosphingobium sp. G106]
MSTSSSGELPVAVVGAGFSGTLLAINLLRQRAKVVLVERDAHRLGKGLAFGTLRPEHLLNVRASNMSAFPDDKDHFLRWMGVSSADQANRFVPRLAYGQYLREQLIEALATSDGRAAVRDGEAIGADFDDDGISLRLANQSAVRCRALVLALGNFPPRPIPVLSALPDDIRFDDPWPPDATTGVEEASHILLIGSGLTSVDIALSLHGNGFRGKIAALSRRGLRPRSHAEVGPAVSPVDRPQAKGSQLLRSIRNRAATIGWRSAIDELRPHVQHLWRTHDPAAQDRFLRHARAYWDVHRHRLAPAVNARVRALEENGGLTFAAGQILEAAEQDGKARVTWRRRCDASIETLRVDRVINCTGPEGDLGRTPNLLVRSLLDAGQIRPDVHRLGLDVDQTGRVRDIAGDPQDSLFAVGPMTKGEAWEIVAVPDIRRQVWDLARYLANAHWVGGEGL